MPIIFINTGPLYVWVALYVMNLLLILTVIFAERKSPSATLAWIMILAFVPIVGFLFYIVFNQNMARSKINKLTDKEKYVVSKSLRNQMKEMERDDYSFHCATTKNWSHLIKLNQVYAHSDHRRNGTDGQADDGYPSGERIC